jgi:hypothetical protein
MEQTRGACTDVDGGLDALEGEPDREGSRNRNPSAPESNRDSAVGDAEIPGGERELAGEIESGDY